MRGLSDVKHARENGRLPAKILDILTTWNVMHAPTRCVHGNCTWTSILYPNMELSRMEGGCLVYKWLPMRDYYKTISWNNISQGSTLGFSVFHQKITSQLQNIAKWFSLLHNVNTKPTKVCYHSAHKASKFRAAHANPTAKELSLCGIFSCFNKRRHEFWVADCKGKVVKAKVDCSGRNTST